MMRFLRPRLTRRRVVVATVMAAVAVGSLPALAAAHDPDPFFGSRFGQDQVLEFRWRSGSEPPSAVRTAIRAAATDINGSRGSRAATFAYAAGGANPIGYGAGATCSVNGIACFTRNAPNGFTMWFREQGHRFDWGSLKWCQSYDTAPNGCFDVENIALDEFGHVEGLDHHVNHANEDDYRDAVVQAVSRAKPAAGWNAHKLGRCDVATLQREYDLPSTTAKVSTCLDLSTAVTLAASSGSLPYGGAVTLTATLRIADLDAYERLGNDLLSGRAVALQRRPAGGSSWTAVGAMTTGGSGTYTRTLSLTGSTEFRAVFTASSDEGLRDDNSPVVKVNVAPCPAGGAIAPTGPVPLAPIC